MSSLIRVYTIFHSTCICWTHNFNVKPGFFYKGNYVNYFKCHNIQKKSSIKSGSVTQNETSAICIQQIHEIFCETALTNQIHHPTFSAFARIPKNVYEHVETQKRQWGALRCFKPTLFAPAVAVNTTALLTCQTKNDFRLCN